MNRNRELSRILLKLSDLEKEFSSAKRGVLKRIDDLHWDQITKSLNLVFFSEAEDDERQLMEMIETVQKFVSWVEPLDTKFPLKLDSEGNLGGPGVYPSIQLFLNNKRGGSRQVLSFQQVQQVRRAVKMLTFDPVCSKLKNMNEFNSRKQSLRKISVMKQQCDAEKILFQFSHQELRDASLQILN